MSHKHSLYDTDPHFKIDPDTRLITDLSNKGTTIVQNDHNSERFTFEMPRSIDGHDMSLCNVVEVHYLNIGGTERHSDVYQVDDLSVSPDSDDVVICSWLLSQNATALAGTLNFVLRFMCTSTDEEGLPVVDYAWSTGIYTKIVITPGIFNSNIVVEQYADVLEEWRQELFALTADEVGTYSRTEIDSNLSKKANVNDVYSKSETDALLSNPTITESFLLTNDYSLKDSPTHIVVTSKSDGWFVNNDGVSTSTLYGDVDMMSSSTKIYDIAISGYVKFTCCSSGFFNVYVDGTEVLSASSLEERSFEGSVNGLISVHVEYGNAIFTEFKRVTVIKDELSNIDECLSQSANAFVKMETGKAIRVDDVSPIEHKANVKVSGKNKFNTRNVITYSSTYSAHISEVGEGYVIITSPTDNTYCSIQKTLGELCPDLKVGEMYTLSGSTESTDAKYLYLAGNVKASWKYGVSKIITEDMLNALVVMYGVSNTTCRIDKLQLELGDTTTEYEPYINPSTVTVTACGKNFWRSGLNYPRTVSGVTIDYDPETQIYTFNGTSTAAGDLYTMPNNTYIMRINPGETWTLKVEVMGGDVDGKATSSGKISPLVNTSTYTNTIHANAESLYVVKTYTEAADITKMYFYVYAAGIVFNNLKLRIQFELNNKPTEFEKFVESTNYTPDSKGNVEITSVSPTMTVITDTDNSIINLTYNRDANKVIGDIDSALDELHTYAQALIGGDA